MQIDLRAARQAEIDQKIQTALERYPAQWHQAVSGWQEPGPDAAFLCYAANYLFRTAGVYWAMDPYTLFTRLKQPQLPGLAGDLSKLQLVALTHLHADHLDLKLIAAIHDRPITWIIPEFMLERLGKTVPLERMHVIIPQPGLPVHFAGLTLIPFDGQHILGDLGVPEMGYLVEFNGKRWLFPGDTRDYDYSRLPAFPQLDGVFAHLWLGKGAALDSPPPQLDAFCRFFAALRPNRMVVTHLDELGREPEDLWTDEHFEVAREMMHSLAPEIQVQMAKYCQQVDLSA